MSSLHTGLRHGSRRLLRILRAQQLGSTMYSSGQRTAAASDWQLRKSEFLRGPQQCREFLMVAESKHPWTGSPAQHILPPAATESCSIQASSFFSAAPEVGVKEGRSGSSTDESKVSAAEEKGEPVSGSPEGEAEAAPKDTSTPKVAQVKSKEAIKIDELRDQLEEADEELLKVQKSMKEMEDRMLRNLANAQNMVDRSKREAESSRKFAVQGFAKDLLDVADNLSRAAAAVPKNLSDSQNATDETSKHLQALLQGVEMTEKQLLQAFKKHGLEKDDPIGKKFDPNFHSAVFEVDDESKEAGTVAVVLKSGYKLHDRVIRPANVGVVKEKVEAEPESQS